MENQRDEIVSSGILLIRRQTSLEILCHKCRFFSVREVVPTGVSNLACAVQARRPLDLMYWESSDLRLTYCFSGIVVIDTKITFKSVSGQLKTLNLVQWVLPAARSQNK